MYRLDFTPQFRERVDKLTKRNLQLKKRLKVNLTKLQEDPKHGSLESHLVETKNYGKQWSSSITGDLRIIWDYSPDEPSVIILVDFGGHTGKHAVYN